MEANHTTTTTHGTLTFTLSGVNYSVLNDDTGERLYDGSIEKSLISAINNGLFDEYAQAWSENFYVDDTRVQNKPEISITLKPAQLDSITDDAFAEEGRRLVAMHEAAPLMLDALKIALVALISQHIRNDGNLAAERYVRAAIKEATGKDF